MKGRHLEVPEGLSKMKGPNLEVPKGLSKMKGPNHRATYVLHFVCAGSPRPYMVAGPKFLKTTAVQKSPRAQHMRNTRATKCCQGGWVGRIAGVWWVPGQATQSHPWYVQSKLGELQLYSYLFPCSHRWEFHKIEDRFSYNRSLGVASGRKQMLTRRTLGSASRRKHTFLRFSYVIRDSLKDFITCYALGKVRPRNK